MDVANLVGAQLRQSGADLVEVTCWWEFEVNNSYFNSTRERDSWDCRKKDFAMRLSEMMTEIPGWFVDSFVDWTGSQNRRFIR